MGSSCFCACALLRKACCVNLRFLQITKRLLRESGGFMIVDGFLNKNNYTNALALNLRNLQHCVSPSFSQHILSKHTHPIGETYNVKLCIDRRGATLGCATKSAKHYAHTCFSFVLPKLNMKQRVPALATLHHHFCIAMREHISP